ncbi:MAG: ABC transporter permease [Desulfarculales bacterium]|nr:ABC transporter permease [Desulfarculales bacterium]
MEDRQSLEIYSRNAASLRLDRTKNREWTLYCSGAVSVNDLAGLEKYFLSLSHQPSLPEFLDLDLSGLDYLDSASCLFLSRLETGSGDFGLPPVRIKGLKPELARIKELVDHRSGRNKEPLRAGLGRLGPIVSLGMATHAFLQDLYALTEFFGNIIYLSLRLCLCPRLLRWKDMALQMQLVGWGGLPVIGLIALLLGMIISFMSIMQLRPYGAEIYVSSLVAVAMVKELGPIMTAIVLAGRSGSSFAAEIGAMKENEELAALAVMGYDPILFLAIPRITATVLVMPLLAMFANFFGILGGVTVGVALMGLSAHSYINNTVSILAPSDLILSGLKVTVFAFLIAAIGCQRGFMVRGGASAVGQAATSSVVTSIFVIILVDSLFAMVQLYGGW